MSLQWPQTLRTPLDVVHVTGNTTRRICFLGQPAPSAGTHYSHRGAHPSTQFRHPRQRGQGTQPAHKGPFVEPISAFSSARTHRRGARARHNAGTQAHSGPGVGNGQGLGQDSYAAPGWESGLASTLSNLCPAFFHLQMIKEPSGKSLVHRKAGKGRGGVPVKVVSFPQPPPPPWPCDLAHLCKLITQLHPGVACLGLGRELQGLGSGRICGFATLPLATCGLRLSPHLSPWPGF